MNEKSWLRVLTSCSDNRKSKIENWGGLSPSLSHSRCVGLWPRRSSPTKVPRIGYPGGVSFSANTARHEAFRQGLRELGYVDGKNIVIDWRSADGKLDRLPALAAELARLKVAVIVTSGGNATRAAKEATNTIPVVMTNDSDPVGDGMVSSLARPGGNITGLSTLAPELHGKRLEILREVVPKLSRVAVLQTSTNPAVGRHVRELELAAKAFGVKLQYFTRFRFQGCRQRISSGEQGAG
jgi:putative ABC transport system substrate-binding protein